MAMKEAMAFGSPLKARLIIVRKRASISACAEFALLPESAPLT
jgi:hypothetical protein